MADAPQVPQDYIRSRPAKLNGDPVVSNPYDTAHKRLERYLAVARKKGGDELKAYGTAAPAPNESAILTARSKLGGDHKDVWVYEVYEDLPGPELVTSRIDPEDGSVVTEIRQTVLSSPSNVGSTIGGTTIRYEPRGDSAYVSIKTTRTTAFDGVVRSLPTRVNVKLPRVLAGAVVAYSTNKGVGEDTSTASGDSTSSVRFSASARGSSSLSISPEIYLPIRDYSDMAENTPAIVKQVYLTGGITEAALLTKLSAVHEVVVTGSLSPAAGGTYVGNSSNRNGVIWFSLGSYVLGWEAGVWKLGTESGIAAGNYWTRTAAATAWLGAYTAHGTNTGAATVGAGRTVNAWPNWGTQEANFVTAGKSVSVSSNASANKDVADDGTHYSLSLSHGFSVSVGGNQSRYRVEPTLHGEIIIPNPTYSDSVNATAEAVLPEIPAGTSTGTSSGFGGDSHAQTMFATVKPSRIPPTVPTDIPSSGLYLMPDFRPSTKDDQYTGVLATIVDFANFATKPAFIGYADPAPLYHQGIAIVPNYPIFLGGVPTSYSISPALVAGLSLNTTTGIISGTPSIGTGAVTHTVTATNAQGSDSATIVITAAI